MGAPRKYPDELRERAIRMVIDARTDPEARVDACCRIGGQLGINADTLRGWVNRLESDTGKRPGVLAAESRRIAELEREVREPRRANGILKSASAFFAAELDRPIR